MHRAELARRRDIGAALAAEAAALAARMRAEGRGTARLKGSQDFRTEAEAAGKGPLW